ncbi:MAG: hypothetical protein EOO62_13335 [Hymenobacter sp.]|nr:MAG: hypothetical protein EOO62_13335 [Hymenobacter sp.]
MNNTIVGGKFLLAAALFFGLASRPLAAQTPNPLTCSTTSYLFQNNVTDVYEIDLTDGKSYRRTNSGIPGIATSPSNVNQVTRLNAFGFNQVDKYIWGMVYGTTLVARIGKDNAGNYLGQTFSVTGLPAVNGTSNNFVVGDVSPSGKMYVAVGGTPSTDQIYIIDLTKPSSSSTYTATTLTTTLTIITDWAVSPIDGNLYAVSSNVGNNTSAPTLYRFLTADRTTGSNPASAGTRETLGVLAGITSDKNNNSTSYNFGSAFMDVNGSFYNVLNSTGAIYRIDSPEKLVASSTATPTATYVNTPNPTVSSDNTDGARCSAAKIAPLPVVLTSFGATVGADRRVQLTWTTANEQNNDFFEVQHSVDGQTFATVGQVAGHQTTAQASAYSFSYAAPGAETTHYYRLRQVDIDGTATYSPVRPVTLTPAAGPWQLSAAPNPTSADAVRVQVQATAAATAVLEVRSLLGQCLLTQAVSLQPGTNQLALRTQLAPGLYWLSLAGESGRTASVKVFITN